MDLMGKKRQKVQWFPVDGLAWAGGEEGVQVGGGHEVATPPLGRGLMCTACSILSTACTELQQQLRYCKLSRR